MPSAFRRTLPLATPMAAPPAVTGLPLMAVTVRPAFSKLSLASTARVTGTSSLVEAESGAMSATGAMVMVRASVSVSGVPVPVLPPSLVVIVSVTRPLASATGVKTGAATLAR